VRILQVTPYFAPAWAYGGPPRVMTDYAVGLAALGHEVDVYTTDALDAEHRAAPSMEMIDGVQVRRFRNASNRLAWTTKKYLPIALPAALARTAGNYDAVHVTDTRTFLTASAHLASVARHVPLVLSAHGSLGRSEGLRRVVKGIYDEAFVRPMLARSPLLLAQTSHEAAMYEELGGRPDATRLLPLPLPPIAVPSKPGAFRASIGVPADERLLLFVGRIVHHKGLDLLIEAVQPLLGAGMTLAVVGRDDGQLPELRRRFADLFADGRVRFAGPLYGDDRFGAYADADVFCLTPPHWEETSVASLEAAATGTPVVLSRQAELPGIEEAGGGFMVSLDPVSIRKAVRRALECRDEMGLRARNHVLAQHDSTAVVARLAGYLSELVAPAS
jgi:glycosyltransferase involved in cell wall biosynthesis